MDTVEAAEVAVQADAAGRLTHIGHGWEQVTGSPAGEATGRPLAQFVNPEDRHLVEAPMEASGATVARRRGIVRLLTADGRDRWVELRQQSVLGPSGELAAISVVLTDISTRDLMEVQQRHAQKLQAVGQLAAGVAHEINTPIQFIGDNAHFLEDAFRSLRGLLDCYRANLHDSGEARTWTDRVARAHEAEEEADSEYIEKEIPDAIAQVLEGVQRVASIVRALKAFAHPDEQEMRPLDLNQALLNTLTVARNEYKYVADVVTDLGDIPPVQALAGDLNQVFLNLIINAADAISDAAAGDPGDGAPRRGLITITTALDGDEVVVGVADNGVGIPPEVATRIFEPFFTTKEVGRGTGQGLALVDAVVRRHGGRVDFGSRPGAGTTFWVRLPLSGAV